HPASDDHVTVALRGAGCAVVPLVEHFPGASPGTLRIRFIDMLGKDTPTRLYVEQDDGSFAQVAAVSPFGRSGPEGIEIATPGMARSSVRLQVGPELSSAAGTPGYQVPTAVLSEGATLLVFNRLLALQFVRSDGPPPEIPSIGNDPAGMIRINPNI